MFKILVLIRRVFLTVIIFVAASVNQSYAKTVEKIDGRFTFSKKINLLSGFNGGRFIKSMTLETQWWTLLGQPVEYYKLKWEIEEAYQYGNGHHETLYRRDLRQYPDLLKKYNALKPLDLELKLIVEFSSDESLPNTDNSYFRHGFAMGSRILTSTPHLMIAKSGEIGDNITPVSPQSWSDFVKYSNSPSLDKSKVEKNSQDVFKYAKSVWIRDLQLKNIVEPREEARTIHEELKRREKAKEVDEDEAFWNGEEEKELVETKNVSDENIDSDFWSGIDSEALVEHSEDGDSGFWNTAPDPEVVKAKLKAAAERKETERLARLEKECGNRSGNYSWSPHNNSCEKYTPKQYQGIFIRKKTCKDATTTC